MTGKGPGTKIRLDLCSRKDSVRKHSDKKACGRDSHTLVEDHPGNLVTRAKAPVLPYFRRPRPPRSKPALQVTCMRATAAAKSLRSWPTLCDPLDCSPPDSAVRGILQQEHWCGKQNCHMTQQSHSWACTPRKPDLKETRAPQCSSQHCLS